MKEDYLVLSNLIKEFGGAKDTVVAVDRVSLQVREGELVTLLGPSGCGKTTTLRMIAGFEFPSSGDIYLVFEPNVFINDFDGLTVASTHGSPWRYDTFVPVIFAGAGLPAVRVSRPITPYDIAPTLAAYLSVKPPSGSIGMPLPEVLK